MNAIDTFNALALKFLSSRYAKEAGKNLPKRLRNSVIKELTEEQKQQCLHYWAPLTKKLDWRYWTLYNSHSSFNPLMVPDDLFVRDIIRTLNPIRMVYALQTKSNYPFLYRSLNKPHTVLMGINGQIYDENNEHVEESKVLKVLERYAKANNSHTFILKPTGGFGGIGVRKIELSRINDSDIRSILNATSRCFVCQEMIKQSSLTAVFNDSSLNTFRINTLNLNGNITSTNVLFRHGRDGAIVDNGGSGGICCGVDNSGRFTGLAYDAMLNRYSSSPSGISYGNVVIHEVSQIVSYAINAHRTYLPMMGHAAWDFGIDESNKPVFIEVNLGWPGIVIEQLACNAPIYGDRCDEVIEYASRHRHIIKWTEFTGDWI